MTTNNPYDKALKNSDGKTLIIGNGSTWYGQPEDAIESLIEVLKAQTLCPRLFHQNLYQNQPWDLSSPNIGEFEKWRGAHHFFGNFRTYSHGFNIVTLDEDLALTLQQLINANIKRDEFIDAALMMYTDHYVGQKGDVKMLVPPAEVRSINLDDSPDGSVIGRRVSQLGWYKDVFICTEFTRALFVDLQS